MVEFSCVLVVFTMFMMMPVINVSSTFLKMWAIDEATRYAANRAAKSRAFVSDSDGTSMMTLANQDVRRILSTASGVRLKGVKVRIVATKIVQRGERGRTIVFDEPVQEMPSTDNYVFKAEVQVRADIDPFIRFPKPQGLGGKNPKFIEIFTDAYRYRGVASEVCEDPTALTR